MSSLIGFRYKKKYAAENGQNAAFIVRFYSGFFEHVDYGDKPVALLIFQPFHAAEHAFALRERRQNANHGRKIGSIGKVRFNRVNCFTRNPYKIIPDGYFRSEPAQ